MSQQISITAFYLFTPIPGDDLQRLRQEFIDIGINQGMRGLVLLAEEGINGTVCGTAEAIAAWKKTLTDRFGPITFKDSYADDLVFKRWSVKLKPEIVGLKRQDIIPRGKNGHLSPQEFHEMLQREDVVVIDARNSYEYQIGKFKHAIDCGTRTFGEFAAFVEQANIPKDAQVMMYCTGGIRCEKASLAMQEKGFLHVYQLDGGILAYLQEFPEGAFEGECFVFDKRCAVDQHLAPSQTYDICPHCGLPGSESVPCTACKKEQKICSECRAGERWKQTCSKRCAHEVKRMQHV